MEGSDKFSQSYDHYKILCKLATGHALTCLSTQLNRRFPHVANLIQASFIVDTEGWYRVSQSPSLLISGSGSWPQRKGLLSPAARQYWDNRDVD